MRIDEHSKAVGALVEMRYEQITAVPTINEPGERFRIRASREVEARVPLFHAGSCAFSRRAIIFTRHPPIFRSHSPYRYRLG